MVVFDICERGEEADSKLVGISGSKMLVNMVFPWVLPPLCNRWMRLTCNTNMNSPYVNPHIVAYRVGALPKTTPHTPLSLC